MTPETSQSLDSESSDFLQQRLAAFARMMFSAFVILRLAEFTLYRFYLDIWPNHYWTIFTIGTANVVLLAATWLGLSRWKLDRGLLPAIDVFVMGACATVFGVTAMLAANRPESAYTCLVYACFMVFMRTIAVPSSGWRTVVVSSIAMIPLLIGALYLAITTREDVPGPAFFAGAALFTTAGVGVAATGSRVIYGLRRRVSSLAREELELGQYTLVRKIGEGKTGSVYVARHALLRRPTAIKLVAPTNVSDDVLGRCERAVREMSQLRHYNTVAVYDYGRSPEGEFYFAMEYLEGLDLEALRERYGVQPANRVIAILIQVCGALHEAHQRGFAHGNIKPANVILCERGGLYDVAKLTDFGFATTPTSPPDDLLALQALARSLIGNDEDRLDACFARSSSAKELAVALEATAGDGWSSKNARDWWADHRKTSVPSLPAPTTLSVDLARRTSGGV